MTNYRSIGRWLLALSLGTVALGLVTFEGCGSGQKSGKDPTEAFDRVYDSYLNGNANEARSSLQEALHLLDQTGSPQGQAFGLFLTYSRLYALEAREGQPDIAEAYFIKARYWFVRNAEIGNGLEQEIGKKIRAFTTNACVAMVDDWDREHSSGRGAKYLQKGGATANPH